MFNDYLFSNTTNYLEIISILLFLTEVIKSIENQQTCMKLSEWVLGTSIKF